MRYYTTTNGNPAKTPTSSKACVRRMWEVVYPTRSRGTAEVVFEHVQDGGVLAAALGARTRTWKGRLAMRVDGL